MKAQSLWRNYDYAYIEDRGRDMRFRSDVKRIKVLSTFKEKAHYTKKNLTTYAECKLLKWDGTDTGRTITVRAYDIVDFWDDFYGEWKEKLDQVAEQRALREAREEEEKRKRDELARINLMKIKAVRELHPFLQNQNIHIHIGYGDLLTVSIPSKLVEELMNEYVSAT